VFPGQAGSAHLTELPAPTLGSRDLALTAAQVPDWLPGLLTHRVAGWRAAYAAATTIHAGGTDT
jgi:hypothetical protein